MAFCHFRSLRSDNFMHVDTSLLREKFIIKERTESKDDKPLEIQARSNRMVINLQAGEMPVETLVIRTNTMHTCSRMVALMIANYEKHGPLSPRLKLIEWPEMWDLALNDYERRYNDDRWLSIYYKGKIVYSYGKHHHFFDVIEQCDIVNKGEYNESLDLAKRAFKKAGKLVNISYDSNVALVAILGTKYSRCSMVLRAPDHKTTFNYVLKPLNEGEKISITQGLSSAGDFLEVVQLSYLVGINNEKLNQNIIEKFSDEAKKGYAARERINELEAQINSMENRYKVRYRPERPLFEYIIEQAEKYAKTNMIDEDEIYIE